MKNLLVLLLMLLSTAGYAQTTVDTSGGNVVVKQVAAKKSISIFRTQDEHNIWHHHVEYEPNYTVYGDDPDTLFLNFSIEAPHIQAMLDEALKWKKYNFSRFAFNVAPYHDLISRLVDIYASSPQWNEYLRKMGNLQVADTLWDGNVISEIRYNTALAETVLNGSDFLQPLNAFFQRYGYKLTPNGFPEDRQPIVTRSELKSLGKPETLIVPIPKGYFNMERLVKSK